MVLLLATEPAAAQDKPPEIAGIRTGLHPDKTRCVVDLSAPTEYRLDPTADGTALTVLLPQAIAGPKTALDGKGLGVIETYRLESLADGGTALHLRFRKPASVSETFLVDPAGKRGHRLVVDLVAGEKRKPAPPVSKQAPAVSQTPRAPETEKDGEELRDLAEDGSAEARFLLAQNRLKGIDAPADPQEAARLYQSAAEQGHAAAAFKLGYLHASGIGVPQDGRKAVEWFEVAAQQGHTKAQYNLGQIYRLGTGVPADPVRAAQWYARAVANGHVKALFNLGTMYLKGIGVEKDPAKGLALIDAAAESGLQRAVELRETLRQAR